VISEEQAGATRAVRRRIEPRKERMEPRKKVCLDAYMRIF
jgi:hypothetical protein